MGGDFQEQLDSLIDDMLKSTPPAWAGTNGDHATCKRLMLKSTPPAWAGTQAQQYRECGI